MKRRINSSAVRSEVVSATHQNRVSTKAKTDYKAVLFVTVIVLLMAVIVYVGITYGANECATNSL